MTKFKTGDEIVPADPTDKSDQRRVVLYIGQELLVYRTHWDPKNPSNISEHTKPLVRAEEDFKVKVPQFEVGKTYQMDEYSTAITCELANDEMAAFSYDSQYYTNKKQYIAYSQEDRAKFEEIK